MKLKKKETKRIGFVLVVALWLTFTFLCYFGVITFDSSTLGGAILSGFILASSTLGILQLLRIVYDRAFPVIADFNESY
jgi:uncharacterized membrane protein (DUF485 family)